jgi:hypothetical protein
MSEEKQLLSIDDAMRLTGRSRRTLLRWFENEPGVVLLLGNPETMHKRRYRTFRIPRAVFHRVITARSALLVFG